MSRDDYLNDNWNHPDIRKAERLLRNDKDEAEQRAYDRRVTAPLVQDLQAEADEANEATAALLAQLDSDWLGMLSRNGIVKPANVRQTRRDAVLLPDGRTAWLNPETRCLEFT
jgi:hypothetical protein